MSVSLTASTTEEQRVFPAASVAWTATGVMVVLFALSYLDRQIISLMVGPIRQEFGLGDFQIGLLQGFAFALLYAVCGLPLGMAVDRYSRRKVIFWGVIVWSAASTACGLARSYEELLLARFFVGAGEAALAPAAYSILADMFPKRRLTFALSVFMLGALAGAELSLAIGGFILKAAAEGVTLPLLGHLSAWRFAFVVTGLPGFVLAFLIFAVPEPMRATDDSDAPAPGWKDVFGFMAPRWAFFACHFIGFSSVMALVYARLAWSPTFLMRRFDWKVADAGVALAGFGLAFGTVALLTGGMIVDRMVQRGWSDAHFRYYVVGGLVMTFGGAAAYLMPDPVSFFVLYVAPSFFLGMGAIGASAIQMVTPAAMRGRVSAIYLLVVSLVGMTLGPAAVGFLTDRVFADPTAIHLSLSAMFAVLGSIATIAFFLGLRPMRDAAFQNGAAKP